MVLINGCFTQIKSKLSDSFYDFTNSNFIFHYLFIRIGDNSIRLSATFIDVFNLY